MILLKYRLELVSTLSVIIGNKYTFYSVPGPVDTLSSLISTTWAIISWSVPSYIPINYRIMTYEIGYTTHQSNGSCSPSDEFGPLIKTNTSTNTTTNVTISNLIANMCYLFGVRGYTVNGYRVWRVPFNQTLVVSSTTHTTVATNGGKIRIMLYFLIKIKKSKQILM